MDFIVFTFLLTVKNLAIITSLYIVTGIIFYMLFTAEVVELDSDITTLRTAIFVLMAPLLLKYVVQMLAAPAYVLKEKFRKSSGLLERNPKVSVIVPAWNEEVGILKTMQSVIDTRYPNLELIVVNDGSTDRTHDIVSQYLDQHNAMTQEENKAVIKYLHLKNGGKANAMNQALNEVTGEFVVTVDADSYMDSDAIVNILKQFDGDEKVGAVAGNVIVGNRKKPIALLQQLEYLYGFYFKRADSMFNAVYIIGGAAAAYRKSVLDIVGGFDHAIITEDIEMSTRILAHGYKARYAADAVIYTEGPSEWEGLCKQRLRWKFGRLLTFIKHKDLFFNPAKTGNLYLSCLLLPVAVLGEFCLLIEPVLLAVFYGYTVMTQDFLPLAYIVSITTALVLFQIAIDSKARFHRNILVLAPVAWISFYAMDAVEFRALCQSIKKLVTRQKLEWQVWKRVGLVENQTPSPQIVNKVQEHVVYKQAA